MCSVKLPIFYRKSDRNQQYAMICCFFIFVVNGLSSMILGSFLPLISSEYELNNTISGALLSSHQVGNLTAGFLAGIIPIYLGRKKAIIFLSSFTILGFLLMITTGNPFLLMFGFLCTGLSRGSISNFCNTLVNEVSKSSPSALSILHSMFAIGGFSAPFVVILCTSVWGERGWKYAACFVIALALIAMLLFSYMTLSETKKKKGKMSYQFMKTKEFIIAAGIIFFYLAIESSVNGWIVKYFVDEGIMTTGYAQMLASLLWVVILFGRLTCAFYGDKIGRKLLLISTSVGTSVFYLLLLSTKNLVVITIAIMGLGFSMAGIYPTTISSFGETIKAYPMALGVLLMIGGIGSITTSMVIGTISDAFGIAAGMSVIVFAMIMMCIFVLAYVYNSRKHNA